MNTTDTVLSLLAYLTMPVLMPEQADLPEQYAETDTQGRPLATGQRGLLYYLAAHPGGFVQISEPQFISADQPAETWWVTITAVAATRQACSELALSVRRALAGTWDDTGDFETVLASQPESTGPGVYVCAPTYAYVLVKEEA